MNAREALQNLQNRQLSVYTDNIKRAESRMKDSVPVYLGVDDRGRHVARKLNGDRIYAPQSRLITGGNLPIGRTCAAWTPTGSINGFIDGMQRG